jgi:hypothetical protein
VQHLWLAYCTYALQVDLGGATPQQWAAVAWQHREEAMQVKRMIATRVVLRQQTSEYLP